MTTAALWLLAATFAPLTASGQQTLPANRYSPPDNRVYQYCVAEDPADPANNGRSYLWLPEGCTRVNGLFLAPLNMDERTFLEFSETRALCRELGLGIIIMCVSRKSPFVVDSFPDLYPNKQISGQKIFQYKAGAVECLQRLLDRMADQTGYHEIRHAPLIPMGHSWAGAFPMQVAYGIPGRTLCVILWKTGGIVSAPPFDTSARLEGVPVLTVEEQEGPNLDTTASWDNWNFRLAMLANARQRPGNSLGNPISRLVQYGGGHCEMSPPMMRLVVEYVREACRRRLPETSTEGPIRLESANIRDGWLVDEHLEKTTSEAHPTAPYDHYAGNRDTAAWYFTEKLARDCERHFREQYHRPSSQAIAFLDPGSGKPLAGSGRLVVSPLADDQSFSARAVNLERTGSPWYPSGTALTQSSTPIQYAVVMGEVEQIGPELFRVVIDRFGGGGCGRTIQACNYGDARCQPAMTTAMLDVEPVKGGASQNLEFPPIADVPLGSRSIPLKAAADSGLPVGYTVHYGPVVVEGDQLRILEISPRCRLPIEVKLAAYQWGKYGVTPVAAAGPIVRTFHIVAGSDAPHSSSESD